MRPLLRVAARAWTESAALATSPRRALRFARTGVSTIGQIGSPVTRSSTYSQPIFVLAAMILRGLPSIVTSSRFGAIGMS